MILNLNFTNKKLNKNSGNIIIFIERDKFYYDRSDFSSNEEINLIKTKIKSLNKNDPIFSFFLVNGQRIILIKIDNISSKIDNERIGGKFYDYLENNNILNSKTSLNNIENLLKINNNFLNEFWHGTQLKSYSFNIYKTNSKKKFFELFLPIKLKKIFKKNNFNLEALLEGIITTKDLVSEPGNILHPDEYVKRIKNLKKIGLKITIYDKKKLKQMGMNALLGVGQGSVRGSYLVTIEWRGSKKNISPLSFVGKGVCFDTGGISLKPAKFMEDMTYDMAGSAVVVGLMKTLALRKAKVNAVGVVGLVENMPDGNAQRPGDIVKSYSGKTIEILNTDAEGRLVLADALSYTEKKFKPKFIVDLATLTGAIIVSLGSEYAGLFSNDDKISDQLTKAGEKAGEKVWRMPLNDNYDKLIDSKKADMQNINYVGGAGSTTAAQFLQRFILNKTPWAHLDIAGMAFSKYGGALNSGGATGYGVRLLNQLIEDNYE
jgi:leucyl aminopeptidase